MRTSHPGANGWSGMRKTENTNAPVQPERWPDNALRDAVKLRQAGLRARERTKGSTPRLPVHCTVAYSGVRLTYRCGGSAGIGTGFPVSPSRPPLAAIQGT